MRSLGFDRTDRKYFQHLYGVHVQYQYFGRSIVLGTGKAPPVVCIALVVVCFLKPFGVGFVQAGLEFQAQLIGL